MRKIYALLAGTALLAALAGCASHTATNSADDAAAWKAKNKPPAGYLAMAQHAGAGPSAGPAAHPLPPPATATH